MSRKTQRNSSTHASRSIRASVTRAIHTSSGISSGLALGALACSGPLQAADADQQSTTAGANSASDQQPIQEVVVTGIRASLQKSLDVKQQAVGIVEAISAEDIGTFPDSTLGEAMQRVPGVTVDRTAVNNYSGAAVSIGDASGIAIRGFGGDFVETLVDGRQMASANGRGIDYASVGADFVSQVDVLETPDFALSTGDIGGTVNIKFPKPFDKPGFQARAFGSGVDYGNDGRVTPSFGGLVSDTFFNDTVGILIDGDYTDRRDIEAHLDIPGWEGTYLNSCQMAGAGPCLNANGTPMSNSQLTLNASKSTTPTNTFPSWFPQEYSLYKDQTYDRRKDGRLVIQWHPSDALMVTANADYSDDLQSTYRSEYSTWFNSTAMYNVTQAANGSITDFSYGPEPTDLQADIDGTYIQNLNMGLNVRWDVASNLTAELDADQSASHLDQGGEVGNLDVDVGYGPSVASNVAGTNGWTGQVIFPGTNSLPQLTNYGPNNNQANVLGNGIIGSHVLPIQAPYASDYIDEAKLDVTWHTDATKVTGGLQWTDDTRNQYEYDTFTNNAWQLFGGYGPVNGNGTGHGVNLPASLFTGSISTVGAFPGWSPGGTPVPPALLEFNPYQVINYLLGLGVGAANPNTISAGYAPYTGGSIPLGLSPGSISLVQEKTYSPFVTAQQKLNVGGMPLTVDVGLRYDHTQQLTGGIERLPTSIAVEASDHTAFVFNYTNPQFLTTSNDYHYILPSLDLNLLVDPTFKVRADASRTLTRPPLSDITPTLNVGGRVGALTATGNNPYLAPYLSTNYDLGAEWYYAQNSYLALDAFMKQVTGFPQDQTVITTINGVTDPTQNNALAQWAKTTFLNGPSADVKGFEGTWQQMLPLGFGYQLNGTYLHSNQPYNPSLLTAEFALPGIASSVNFVGFYQRAGFQARVAINWRSEELEGIGQEQNGSKFGTEPTFLDATTEVDFSTSYEINRNLSVFFEALNLTDAQLVTHGRFDNQILNVIDYGRSFTLGARAKF